MKQLKVMIGLVLGLGFAVQAADISKANNTDSLNLTTSWTGGAVPGSGDTAVFSNLAANSTALGADASWLGIMVTNNTGTAGATTINAGNTLTLGSGGIRVGGTNSQLNIYANINQSADALYNLGSKNLYINGVLSGAGNITKADAGNFIITNNNSGFSGNIAHNAGLISVGLVNSLGTGTLTMGAASLNSQNTAAVLDNNIVLNGVATISAVTASRNLTLNGVLSGNGSVNVGNGSSTGGFLVFSGNNTFSGGLTLGAGANVGTVKAGHNNAFGTGTLTVNTTLGGGGLGTTASVTLTNTISLAGTLNAVQTNNLTLNGVISGAGNVNKTGSGVLILGGDNTFSGGITNTTGLLSVNHDRGLGTGVLTMNGGTLNAGLSGSRTPANNIVLASGTVGTFTAVNTGRNITLNGVISGDGSLLKNQVGMLTLNGANTYTNTTLVSAGKLAVNGSLASALVTVTNGAALGGSGSVQSVNMLAGSTLEPGSGGTGTMTFKGDLTLAPGSTNIMELSSLAAFDQLAGNGSNTLNISGEIILNFTGGGAVNSGDTFDVFRVSSWGAVTNNGAGLTVLGLPSGMWVDAAHFAASGQAVVCSEPVNPKAVGQFYAGFYRGTNMAQGLYTFTDPARPLETAVRIGTATNPSTTYRGLGFDGQKYITVNRSTGLLYGHNGIAASFIPLGDYDYSAWHGIELCNKVYYGIYDGTNTSSMTGPGLYLFADPADPEKTCVKICTNQTFASNLWTDVAFDGERYLFVRDASAGGGIYQYDPGTDQFMLISGSETYADWEGLAAFDSNIAPLLNRKVYLLLFGGQSNAVGYGGYRQYLLDTGNPLAFPQDDIDLFYNSPYPRAGIPPLNTLMKLQPGTGHPDIINRTGYPQQYPELTQTPICRFGSELSFSRTVRDRINIPNAQVAIVKYAWGGTSLYNTNDWHPDGTANRAADAPKYRTFQETVWRSIAALRNKYPYHEVEILGMGWVHGSTDASSIYCTDYQTNLTVFIKDIRATFGTNITFVLSKLSENESTDPRWDVVRAAQQAVADADPKVEVTSTSGDNYAVATNYTEGPLHYMSPALLQIGQDLGNALMSASGLDSDDDGLPDLWENSYAPGSAGLGNTPDADYDQDGITDQNEFLLGTSPVDPADRLTLANTGLRGRWSAKKDVRYQVFTSSNLVSWTEFGAPVLSRGGDSTVDIDFSQYMSTNRAGFFRLQVK
ncbi:MAG: sialate O-acetylesterase [Kiritimatiellales bacterium]|jgi:autotransporter-associated beta strand protein